jgi:hypothetical protein
LLLGGRSVAYGTNERSQKRENPISKDFAFFRMFGGQKDLQKMSMSKSMSMSMGKKWRGILQFVCIRVDSWFETNLPENVDTAPGF